MMDINTWNGMMDGSVKAEDVMKAEYQHQEQPNENYFEEINDYLDGTMSV